MLKWTRSLQPGWYFQLVLFFSFLWVPAFAQQSLDSFQETQSTVQLLIDRAYPFLEKLYHNFHSHPELSFYEKETSARLARELKNIGFDVSTQIGGYGVVGLMKNGRGPTIMIRTDMDALPITEETGLSYASRIRTKDEQGRDVVFMHACGHGIV